VAKAKTQAPPAQGPRWRRPEYYRVLGGKLAGVGRIEEAALAYRHCLSLEPDHALARHLLAGCPGEDVPDRAADEFVRALFHECADGFDSALAAIDYQAPARVAATTAEAVGGAGRALEILDAGCGTGLCGPLLRALARRLVGVDLSPAMLAKARARSTYDELIEAELGAYLTRAGARFDVIASADTLVYFGDLGPLVRAAAGALRSDGVLVFTVEHEPDEAAAPRGFRLHPHGRYSHTRAHVRDVLAAAELEVVSISVTDLRLERGERVEGLVVTARRCRAPVAGEQLATAG